MDKSWKTGIIIGIAAMLVLAVAAGSVYFVSLSSTPADAVAETGSAPAASAVPTEAPTLTPAPVTASPVPVTATPSLTAEPVVPVTEAPKATAVPTPTPALAMEGSLSDANTPTPSPSPTPTPTPIPTPTPTAEPNVLLPSYYTVYLEAGKTEVRVDLENPKENEGVYHLAYELRIKETDEVLFTTGLIPAGSYCNKATLTRPLEAGSYEAVLIAQPYRVTDWSPTSKADIHVALFVEE